MVSFGSLSPEGYRDETFAPRDMPGGFQRQAWQSKILVQLLVFIVIVIDAAADLQWFEGKHPCYSSRMNIPIIREWPWALVACADGFTGHKIQSSKTTSFTRA